jgi:hypothetical protein
MGLSRQLNLVLAGRQDLTAFAAKGLTMKTSVTMSMTVTMPNRPNRVSMIVLMAVGWAFLLSGPYLGDRSFSWMHIILAAVCFVGAFLLRSHSGIELPKGLNQAGYVKR